MTDAEVLPETEALSDAEAMPMADDFVPGPPVDIDSPQEVELKYAVADPAAVREWIESGAVEGVRLGSWSTRRDEDAYLDTDDRAIALAGFGARLRRRGSRITLTLKSLARLSDATDEEERGSVALHRRIELEGPAGGSADPSSWPPSDARERLLAIVDGAPLRLRFILRQTRAVRELRGEADERAELSLDETTVLYRDTPIGTFSTLEIEALDGSAGLLARMAAALEATGLVMPEARSKEAIASGMLEQHADGGSGPVRDAEAGPEIVFEPRPAKVKERPAPPLVEPDAVPPPPRTPGVRSEDTLGDAGRKVLRMHLLRMLASEAGTRSGEVAEDLHKMRVATRRMRAAWRVFDGAYRPGPQRRYVRELRWWPPPSGSCATWTSSSRASRRTPRHFRRPARWPCSR